MKICFAAIAAFVLASASTVNSTHADGPAYLTTECVYQREAIVRKYLILANGVVDIPDTCGQFWKWLNNPNFHHACVVTEPSCGEDGRGDLQLKFMVDAACNPGHIKSAWWEATHDELGPAICSKSTPRAMEEMMYHESDNDDDDNDDD
ncbi:hypothetical protein ACHAQH_000942 [Verticillium albo-atrum]